MTSSNGTSHTHKEQPHHNQELHKLGRNQHVAHARNNLSTLPRAATAGAVATAVAAVVAAVAVAVAVAIAVVVVVVIHVTVVHVAVVHAAVVHVAVVHAVVVHLTVFHVAVVHTVVVHVAVVRVAAAVALIGALPTWRLPLHRVGEAPARARRGAHHPPRALTHVGPPPLAPGPARRDLRGPAAAGGAAEDVRPGRLPLPAVPGDREHLLRHQAHVPDGGAVRCAWGGASVRVPQ